MHLIPDQLQENYPLMGYWGHPKLTSLEHSLFRERRTDGVLDITGPQAPLPQTPWLVADTPTALDAQPRRRAPNIAEDTRCVCAEILGLSDQAVAGLAELAAIDLVE